MAIGWPRRLRGGRGSPIMESIIRRLSSAQEVIYLWAPTLPVSATRQVSQTMQGICAKNQVQWGPLFWGYISRAGFRSSEYKHVHLEMKEIGAHLGSIGGAWAARWVIWDPWRPAGKVGGYVQAIRDKNDPSARIVDCSYSPFANAGSFMCIFEREERLPPIIPRLLSTLGDAGVYRRMAADFFRWAAMPHPADLPKSAESAAYSQEKGGVADFEPTGLNRWEVALPSVLGPPDAVGQVPEDSHLFVAPMKRRLI